MESAAKNVRELNVPTRELPSITGHTTAVQNPVNLVGDNAPNKSSPTCYRCGKAGQYASVCKYKENFVKIWLSAESVQEQTKQSYQETTEICQ